MPAGAVMVDGLGVGDVGNVVLRDRRHLSQDGLVIVVATVDSRSGQVLAGPDLVSRGFVYVRESEELMDEARRLVVQCFEKCRTEHVRDWNSVKTRVRETLSSLYFPQDQAQPHDPADPDGSIGGPFLGGKGGFCLWTPDPGFLEAAAAACLRCAVCSRRWWPCAMCACLRCCCRCWR